MNLAEFLTQTAYVIDENPPVDITALTDDDALAAWQGITKRETLYVATSTMNALLAQHKLKLPFKEAATDPTHPFRDYADVFVDSTAQPTEFNLNPFSTMGAGVVGMLGEMATGPFVVAGVDYSTIIGQLRDLLVYMGSKLVYPNANTTLHELKINRGTVTLKPITQTNGYAVINILSDCDLHNPRLMATNSRTNKVQRISSFYGVSVAGKYECLVPQEWRNAELFVDDVYSVIE